ncbi:MAG TPA: hypothetical protein VMH04_01920 [Candidatus Solibacter sp.]|nr:hypothetical protein [Candidatus Solibacter sp.]
MKIQLIMGPALLIALSSLVVACGGGDSSMNQNMIGPSAILNGSSLAGSNSYWAASNCPVKMELAADNGFVYWAADRTGTISEGYTTWSPSGDSSLSTGGGTFLWIASVGKIEGSTSSKVFAADVLVTDATNTSQLYPGCSFSLQVGQLCSQCLPHQ